MRLPSRKFFLIIVISSLVASALLGIVAILTSGLGDTGWKVLATTGEIDVAAVLALCCAGKTRSRIHGVFQLPGFASITIGLAMGLVVTWVTNFDNDTVLRVWGISAILSLACAHACLVLPLAEYNRLLKQIVTLTTVCIALVAELLANYILFDNFDPGDSYVKGIGVLLILDVLGTILALILRKTTKPDNPLASSVQPAQPAASGLIQPVPPEQPKEPSYSEAS